MEFEKSPLLLCTKEQSSYKIYYLDKALLLRLVLLNHEESYFEESSDDVNKIILFIPCKDLNNIIKC